MKLNIIVIVILGFFTLFVTNQAYAPCIEGPGNNCNNYPPPALTQISTDKLNYEISDKPIITIMGAPDAVVHLEIDDSSSNIMLFTHDISLAPNGTAIYVLDISSYKPGVYSVIVTSPISKLKTSFSVGLAPTGGRIVIQSDRNSYLPGDNIAIVGTWNSNTLIQLSLIDPSGISVKSSQTFSDKTGHFSSPDLVIPMDAISGIWQIGADSGITHTRIQISVNSTVFNHSKIKLDETAVLSPLKQFKSGIAVNDVKCRQGLQLVIKAKDNSPACVKLDAAYMLIKRGWAASESAYPGGDRQFALDTNSTIIPAHLPRSSGVRVPYSESSRVINYSGFYGVYNETFPYRGTQNDYVLKPGNTGVITFQIDTMVSEQQDQDYSIPLPKSINRTNYVIFYHEIKNLKDLSKYPGVTFDSSNYDVCSTGPAGWSSCIGEQFRGTGPIEAFVTDHPGVDVLFEPPSEVLPLSMNTTSQIVTMTITVDGDAPRGTYLALLPGIGADSFLLTVGNQPYHE
ncbi:MAG: hypothetical protein PXX83_04300 [Candidatus Nitrosotalea sp.]|nr:hypothetical protein [Candidatus Nitrosotalea sp.]